MERQESMNETVRRLVDFYQPEKIYLFGCTPPKRSWMRLLSV
jgi:hypothetical protein